MELNEFIEKFAEQFDDLDDVNLSAGTVFKELDDWTSLVALSVIAMVDEEYDVHIGAKEIMGADTIESLYNMVKALK